MCHVEYSSCIATRKRQIGKGFTCKIATSLSTNLLTQLNLAINHNALSDVELLHKRANSIKARQPKFLRVFSMSS